MVMCVPMTYAVQGSALIQMMTPTRAVVLATQIVTTLTPARRASVRTTTSHRLRRVVMIPTRAQMMCAMAVGRALIQMMTPTRAVVLATQIVTTLTPARRESVRTTTSHRLRRELMIPTRGQRVGPMAVGRALIQMMTPTRAVVLATQIVTTLTPARRESVRTTTSHRLRRVLMIPTRAQMMCAMAVGRALIQMMTPTRAVVLATQIVTTLTPARRESVRTTTSHRLRRELMIPTRGQRVGPMAVGRALIQMMTPTRAVVLATQIVTTLTPARRESVRTTTSHRLRRELMIPTRGQRVGPMAVGRALIQMMTPTRAVVLATQIVTTLTPARRESVRTTTSHRLRRVLMIPTRAPMMGAMAVGRSLTQMMTPTRAVVLATRIVTTLTPARRESVKTTTRTTIS